MIYTSSSNRLVKNIRFCVSSALALYTRRDNLHNLHMKYDRVLIGAAGAFVVYFVRVGNCAMPLIKQSCELFTARDIPLRSCEICFYWINCLCATQVRFSLIGVL